MIQNNSKKNIKEEILFNDYEFSSYDEIFEDYAKEFTKYIAPKGDTIFGFWMQTLADLEFLNLELQGLTEKYTTDPITRTVDFKGNKGIY